MLFTTNLFSPQSGHVVNIHHLTASPLSELQSPLSSFKNNISAPDPMAQIEVLLPFPTNLFPPLSGYMVNFLHFTALLLSELQPPL
jgi:hypothetical protein